MATLLATDLEIQEIIDKDADLCEDGFDGLNEDEKTPIEESVSALVSDLAATSGRLSQASE